VKLLLVIVPRQARDDAEAAIERADAWGQVSQCVNLLGQSHTLRDLTP